MGTYRPLLNVTVEHAYFSGRCKALEFIPAESCIALLHNAGLLLKSSESGIAVYFDAGWIALLHLHAAGHPVLTFKVFSKDPDFFRYTAPGAPPDNAMFTSPIWIIPCNSNRPSAFNCRETAKRCYCNRPPPSRCKNNRLNGSSSGNPAPWATKC